MKHFILFFTIIITLCGCNGNKNTAIQEKAKQDSLALLKAKNDSLAEYIWGNIKFGSSHEDVMKEDLFSDADYSMGTMEGQSYLSASYEKRTAFDDALDLSGLPDIEFWFEDDQLYLATFERTTYDYDDYDGLLDDCGIFTKNFAEKYGKPTKYTPDIPSFNLEKGDAIIYSEFNISTKLIEIYVFRDKYDGSKFGYGVRITNSAYPKKPHKLSDKRKREIEQERAEKSKIIEQSF